MIPDSLQSYQKSNTTPAHQKEYTNLYNNALAAYKQTNQITFTDAATRKTINTILKQMLISQYLSNTNFINYTSFMIYKTIYYARGFLQIQNEDEQTPTSIRAAINSILQEKLIPLLPDPNEIPSHIQEILPFSLPITQRSYTRATVNALRKIFKFDKLTNNYFAKLPTLPKRYQELLPELKTYFPITSRQSLQYLSYFRHKLADYYTFTAIPNSYFQLPPPKQPLPTTYQELNYKVRGLFPFNSSTSKIPLAEAVA